MNVPIKVQNHTYTCESSDIKLKEHTDHKNCEQIKKSEKLKPTGRELNVTDKNKDHCSAIGTGRQHAKRHMQTNTKTKAVLLGHGQSEIHQTFQHPIPQFSQN